MKKILGFFLLIALTSCSRPDRGQKFVPVDPLAPSNLTYEVTYKKLIFQMPMTELYPRYYGSLIEDFTIEPALPAGVQFSEKSGRIAGLPEEISAAREYTITGTADYINEAGVEVTGKVSTKMVIEVVHQEPFGLTYGDNLIVRTMDTVLNISPMCNDGIRLGAVCTRFSISPALPSFLSFNTTTGRISGNITSKFSGDYVVTGHNTGGSTTFDLRIEIRDFVKRLSLGGSHSCAIVNEVVRCWGNNDRGQIGDGTQINRTTPATAVYSSTTLANITAGYDYTCAHRFDNNRLFCWGNNADSQFGPSLSATNFLVPTDTTISMANLSAGEGSTYRRLCGSGDDGAATCYGTFPFGDLSPSSYKAVSSPATPLLPESSYGGDGFSCFLRTGRVYCLGDNSAGQLGDNQSSGASSYFLTIPTGLENSVTSLSVNGKSACAIRSRVSLYCWGEINGQTVPTEVPYTIPDVLSLESVAVGNNFFCVVNSGRVYCQGDNAFGQIGSGSTAPSVSSFQEVIRASDNASIGPVQSVEAGDHHACLTSSNSVYCWGRNNRGQVGVGSFDNSNKARLVSF